MYLSNFLDLERGGIVIVQSNSTSLLNYYSVIIQLSFNGTIIMKVGV